MSEVHHYVPSGLHSTGLLTSQVYGPVACLNMRPTEIIAGYGLKPLEVVEAGVSNPSALHLAQPLPRRNIISPAPGLAVVLMSDHRQALGKSLQIQLEIIPLCDMPGARPPAWSSMGLAP